MKKPYVICNCGRWGWTPPEFDELKHNCKCPNCGDWMFLHHSGQPQDAGYRDSAEITPILGNLR